jgi:Mce-associated membrane protein
VEDQSADSSDLNADAAAASVPQGKAARNRHRLPRQKAPQVEQADEATEAAEATEPAEDGEVEVEAEAAAEEAVETPDGETPDVETEVEEPEEIVLVPHRTAGRALKLVAVAAGVLFVAACAFAGATVQPYLADRAAVHTKFVIAETAANAITTLWTYTPDDMDKLPDRSAKYLGGDFAADYKRYIDAIVAPNKQAQVTNNTQVLGAAVESLTPTEATAIVYTNSVATSPVTKGIPSLRYLSYRLTMKPQDNRWLITQMVAVTKLDLTPRL